MEEKYIKLLLEGSLRLEKNRPLLIKYPLIIRDFVLKLVDYAKKIGIKDIYLDERNPYEVHYVLENSSLKEIKENPLFDDSIWDVYAKKDAAFLMLESPIPGLMEDIDSKKITLVANLSLESKKVYRKKQLKGEIPWCIAVVPNKLWAQKILPNSKDSLKDMENILAKICMLEKNDAIKNWEKFLNKQKEMEDKLNELKITKLHYYNKLGTDLEITLSDKAIWRSAASDKWLVNMPSYEIFTTPDYRQTNGVVYSSKPLIYNGKVIDKFKVEFKNGKVINVEAKKGLKDLQDIIKGTKMMECLGEVALVDYNSPISNTNLVFETTLIDENASCHIALGSGFPECIKGSKNKEEKELKAMGVNTSSNHVDFMIGTKDLVIEAETKKGRIVIMKDGNLII